MSAPSLTVVRSTFLSELLAWLNGRFAPDGPPIHADTSLFAGGLIDSLRVLELIAWTERAIGREIPDAAIRTDNFATPARIAELFTREDSDARR
jgi:acyl carrier protein